MVPKDEDIYKLEVGDILYSFYSEKRLLCAFLITKVNKMGFHCHWFDIGNDETEEEIRKRRPPMNVLFGCPMIYTGNKKIQIGKSMFFTREKAVQNPII